MSEAKNGLRHIKWLYPTLGVVGLLVGWYVSVQMSEDNSSRREVLIYLPSILLLLGAVAFTSWVISKCSLPIIGAGLGVTGPKCLIHLSLRGEERPRRWAEMSSLLVRYIQYLLHATDAEIDALIAESVKRSEADILRARNARLAAIVERGDEELEQEKREKREVTAKYRDAAFELERKDAKEVKVVKKENSKAKKALATASARLEAERQANVAAQAAAAAAIAEMNAELAEKESTEQTCGICDEPILSGQAARQFTYKYTKLIGPSGKSRTPPPVMVHCGACFRQALEDDADTKSAKKKVPVTV